MASLVLAAFVFFVVEELATRWYRARRWAAPQPTPEIAVEPAVPPADLVVPATEPALADACVAEAVAKLMTPPVSPITAGVRALAAAMTQLAPGTPVVVVHSVEGEAFVTAGPGLAQATTAEWLLHCGQIMRKPAPWHPAQQDRRRAAAFARN